MKRHIIEKTWAEKHYYPAFSDPVWIVGVRALCGYTRVHYDDPSRRGLCKTCERIAKAEDKGD